MSQKTDWIVPGDRLDIVGFRVRVYLWYVRSVTPIYFP